MTTGCRLEGRCDALQARRQIGRRRREVGALQRAVDQRRRVDRRVRADRDRLAQAVDNLVQNAYRHGQPPVRLQLERLLK